MQLDKLTKIKGLKTKSKRLGRGRGSGKGAHTVGKGAKGQKARSRVPAGFEGGQTPLYKRLPEYGGFTNPAKKRIVIVPLYKLNVFADGAEVTPTALVEAGIIKTVPADGVKILGNGKIEKKLILKGLTFSNSAKDKLEQAGGTIVNA